MSILTIDGTTFDGVGITKISRKAPFLDKYANRAENGVLKRELIGVYYNYELTFGQNIADMDTYAALYDVLTEATEFHTITVPGTSGTYTYTAYISEVDDELIKYSSSGDHKWGSLTVKFISKSPARS
jgi:hypothetical protein